MFIRPRRNRKNKALRHLVQETHLLKSDIVYPLFIIDDFEAKEEVSALPGQFRLGLNPLIKMCEKIVESGIQAVAIFPAIQEELKTPTADESLNPNGVLPKAIRTIKEKFPDLQVISDVALDPFSSDGHDGIVINGEIDNDKTLPVLAKAAVLQAEAGADIISCSDMMDGRVLEIRHALDEAGFTHVNILSYSAKYASALYGPFREALNSAPKAGDKKTYQMNPANRKEALLEANLDEEEGADILMVKPATFYLDVISDLAQNALHPIAAYHVSGEYSMIMSNPHHSEEDKITLLLEALLSIKRAGADMIFTYGALEVAPLLEQ